MTETIERTAQAVEEIAEVKPYTFRELKADDTFLMFAIISKIGIKEFKAAFEGDTIKQLAASIGGGEKERNDDSLIAGGLAVALDIASVILGNLPRAKNDIYALLASVSGMKPAEIADLGFATFSEMVIDFIKKPEFADFIKAVSRSFK